MSETGHLGRDSILPDQYDRSGNFLFPGGFPTQTPVARVPIYEPYGNISERAYSGKLECIDLRTITPDFLLAVPSETDGNHE
jgi:hypothetical protein